MRILNLTRWVCLISLFWIVFACSPNAPKKIEVEEAQTVIDDWLKLWATYDLDLVDDIFWQDPKSTYFSSEKEGLIKGYDSFIPHHEGFGFVSGGKEAEKSLWLDDLNITIHESSAVVEGIWYFGDRSVPQDQVQNGPVSFVLIRNSQGDVRIAHTHFANYESWKTNGN